VRVWNEEASFSEEKEAKRLFLIGTDWLLLQILNG
jgi:hypothetical protein